MQHRLRVRALRLTLQNFIYLVMIGLMYNLVYKGIFMIARQHPAQAEPLPREGGSALGTLQYLSAAASYCMFCTADTAVAALMTVHKRTLFCAALYSSLHAARNVTRASVLFILDS